MRTMESESARDRANPDERTVDEPGSPEIPDPTITPHSVLDDAAASELPLTPGASPEPASDFAAESSAEPDPGAAGDRFGADAHACDRSDRPRASMID